MAPQLSQSNADYGSIAELDAAQKSARFSKAARVVAVVGILVAGVGLIALTSSPSTKQLPEFFVNLNVDPHDCPQWPEFCIQAGSCKDKFHQGDSANSVPVHLCPDYVADCKYYCVECDCQAPPEIYCNALLASCEDPSQYVPTVVSKPLVACPYGYQQLGVSGSGIEGCGMDGCNTLINSNMQQCGDLCASDATCLAFAHHIDGGRNPICMRYETDVISNAVASSNSDKSDRLVCKKIATSTQVLNQECGFSGSGKSLEQTDKFYPACPTGSVAFDLGSGGLCCTGTCTHGTEGSASDDVICAMDGNPQTTHAACTGYQTDKKCLWAYGSSEAVSVTGYADYIVKGVMTYSGDNAGFLFRMQSSTDAAAARYNLKFDGSKAEDNIVLMYFDGSTETELSSTTAVSVTYASGPVSSAPADGDSMVSAVDTAVATGGTGYCTVSNPDMNGYKNSNMCSGGTTSNIGYKITASFNLAETTTMKFDFNVDFGWGGIVYFDGAAHLEGFQSGNMWWSGNYAVPMSLDLEQELAAGDHTVEIYGAEGCCDGTSNIKVESKSASTGGVYGTAWPLTEANLMLLGSAPKAAIAPNTLHEIQITVAGNTFDLDIDGTRYMSYTDSAGSSQFGGIGLETWKSTMSVHNLQFLTLGGVPIQNTYEGFLESQGAFDLYIDGTLSYQATTDHAGVMAVEASAGATILGMRLTETVAETAECVQGDVKMDAYPTGQPYLYYDGEWKPICGHYFWDNNYGCGAVCAAMGYSYTGATRTHTRYTLTENSIEVGKCNNNEGILGCTMANNYYTETSWCSVGNGIGNACTCTGATFSGTEPDVCDTAVTTYPSFSYSMASGKGTPVSVLTVDHSGGTVGMYFNFNWADLVTAMGVGSLSSPQTLTILNQRTQEEKSAVMWNNVNGGSTGDSHGRFDPYDTAQAGDWKINDLFFIQGTQLSLTSAASNADKWVCKATNELSDAEGDMWYSHDYDHSTWVASQEFTTDVPYGPIASEITNVLGTNADPPTWIGTTEVMGTCTDGSVKLDAYPSGRPYIYYDETWSPICGHYFWDTRYGCDLVCQALGYTGSDGTVYVSLSSSKTTYNEDSIEVGKCGSGDTDLTACTSANNYWPQYTSWCTAGNTVGMECTCEGGDGGELNACGTGMDTLCVLDLSPVAEAE